MEFATSSSSFLKLPAMPSLMINNPSTRRKHGLLARKVFIVKARKDHDNVHHGGKLVDESMIVLRMRIKEMKMLESGHDDQLPSNWMEWEKKYYFAHYNEDVCEAIGLLQTYLMKTRPSLALGTLAILALSVPISTCLVLLNFAELVKGLVLVSGIHAA
ncbi:hypothetical protein ACH5RR_011651 [Cinchona calisaya]|uniref:Mediator of RNA polymerase II transcription subunit n=1 Tax=Cinchona calisaya TaxID=153742 RepID=A0ABD3A943_9GENT